jgi:Zn-dependent protease with chaperone function/Tfp pilus assembly protein PilE
MDSPIAAATAVQIYGKERPLLVVSAIISTLAWLALIVGTLGLALVYVLLGYVAFLFVQSALISHLRGSGVRITPEQFPDLQSRLLYCCERIGIETPPDAYIIHAGGAFNAFATRFRGRNFVVLYSDIVDALEDDPTAINFYIGHELGHLHRRHLQWGPLLWPAGLLPLLGAAYSRAREYTCDAYGAACCGAPESIEHGIAALAVGHRRWRTLNVDAYRRQSQESGGFWMSFHELISDYPWLCKRMARATVPAYQPPTRHPFAWVLGSLLPRMGAGGASSMFVTVAMVGVLAAVAIPAYQDYTVRAKVTQGLGAASEAKAAVSEYYAKHRSACESNDECRLPRPEAMGSEAVRRITVARGSNITVDFAVRPVEGATIVLTPHAADSGELSWTCTGGTLAGKYRPLSCRN